MDQKILLKLAQDFFSRFDPESKVEVIDNDGWWVKVVSPNSGHLIGKMGETLEAIQYVLRLAASQRAGEFIGLTVDIDGYKEKKVNELKELAVAMAENVKNSGYAQEMRPMSPADRRVVHLALKDFPGIKVDSVDEGEIRRIRIEPI